MEHTNAIGRERVNQLRQQGYFRFLGSPRIGLHQTFILCFDKKVYLKLIWVFKNKFKICLRLKAVKAGSNFQQDRDEPKYKALKIEITRFKIAEVAFSSDFRINHFGYDNKPFYEVMKDVKSKSINEKINIRYYAMKEKSLTLNSSQ